LENKKNKKLQKNLSFSQKEKRKFFFSKINFLSDLFERKKNERFFKLVVFLLKKFKKYSVFSKHKKEVFSNVTSQTF